MDSTDLHAEGEDRFSRALADVESGRGPTSSMLAELSHLTPEQVSRLAPIWRSLSVRQKLELLASLHQQESDALRFEFNAVYHLAMDDEHTQVRRAGILATVEDTSEWLLHRLRQLVTDDQDADVRAAAAAGLGPFAQRAELGELDADEARRLRRVLLEALHRPGEALAVRAAALTSIGYFSDERVQHELAQAIHDDELRLAAIEGMGHSADPGWLDELRGQLEDADDVSRAAAARATGEIGDESAVESLVDLIDDPSTGVRLAAIAALGEIGGEQAREALVYALQDEQDIIREAAAAAISEVDFFEEPLQP